MNELKSQVKIYRATRFAIVCACVVLLLAFASYGQKLPSKNYTTADGLANDFVGEIVRDSRGFLWFCTGEGLSRFDGSEFKNYTQADGLPHRNVNDLLELENETYLVATDDGISVFNPHGAVNPQSDERPMFYTFRVPFESSDQKNVPVNDLLLTRKGETWAASAVGIYRVLHDGGDWRLEKIEFDLWRGKNVEISTLEEDRFGRIWLGTVLGLFVYNPETGALLQVPETTGWSLLADEKGHVWSGGAISASDAIHLFDLTDADSLPIMQRHFTKADGLSDDQWIHKLFKTSDGRILAGIRNGLNEFIPDAEPGKPSFRQLFSADIVSVGEDASGNIWVGTSTRGVFKLARSGFTLYQATEKLPYGGVTSIFAGRDAPHEIFVTSSENDVLRFDGETFAEIQMRNVTHRSWSRNQLDFRSRVDGDWWVPSSEGLARFAAVRKFEDLAGAVPKKIYNVADGLQSNAIFNLYEDSKGNVWISTISGRDRLAQWDRASDSIRAFTVDDGLPDNNSVTAFAEDSQGTLWIGFYSGGVARLKNGRFELFSRRTGFPNGYVSAIHADRKGRLWVATSGGGVVRIDNPAADDEPRFINLNVGNGLSSNLATCLAEDNFGRIYVGTARGINRIEPDTGRIKIFTQTDGLPGSSIGRCASDASGDLWFSQKFYLARLNVQADEKNLPPTIYIANLRVNGEPIRKLSELGETKIENLSLASDERQLQIDFFAIGFGTGETLRYQYKFEGENADWSVPSTERTINFNLSPGKYSLLVRAINADGTVSEAPARASFSIARPFWQQWWFILLISILIGLIIYAIYRARIAQIIKLERVRTRIATDLHDDIGASLSKIAILSEVVNHQVAPLTVKNAGVEKSLTEIAETSREMVDSMSDIVWAINPQRDSLSDLIGRMRNLAGEMTELADIGLRIELVNLENTALSLGADLRREIYLMFKETLNNLVKHSQCAWAEIEFKLDGDEFAFKVSDDGRGFSVSTSRENGNRGGNGLPNMQRRATNLGGTYSIESEIDRGTTVICRIPLRSKFGDFNLKNFFSK